MERRKSKAVVTSEPMKIESPISSKSGATMSADAVNLLSRTNSQIAIDNMPMKIGTLAADTTIERLETKGLLKTWMGEATAQRGGRAKRMVRVTAKGAEAAAAFYEAVTRLSRGVPWETAQP